MRIGEAEELAEFYPRLGDALKKHWAGWNCFFFTADLRLPKLVGLRPSRKTPLMNSALNNVVVNPPWNVPTTLVRDAVGQALSDGCLPVMLGGDHSLGVTEAGVVWTWGLGGHGRLGLNDEQSRLVPTLLAAEVFKGSKIVTVAAGGSHTMAVGVDGALWVWGWGLRWSQEQSVRWQ
mgnify:CR=1 FL=1